MKTPANIQSDGSSDLAVKHDPGKGNTIFGLVSLVVCLVMVILLVIGHLDRAGRPGYDPEFGIILGAMFGAGALFFGGWVFWAIRTRRKKTRLYRVEGHDIACYDGYGLLWREPHRTYRQLRWHERLSGMGMAQGIVQVITLDHPRRERCIEIYPSNDKGDFQERSRVWSVQLNLPVLQEKADQGLQRAPDELDKTLLELAAQNRLGEHVELEPAPAGVTCGENTGEFRVTARISLFFAAMAPFLAIGALSQIIEAGSYRGMNFGAVLFGAPAIFLLLTPFAVRQAVRITAKEVIAESRCIGLLLHRSRIPLEAIVRIYHTSVFPGSVVLEGRNSRIKVSFLGKAAGQWLTAFLQRSIVTQHRAD